MSHNVGSLIHTSASLLLVWSICFLPFLFCTIQWQRSEIKVFSSACHSAQFSDCKAAFKGCFFGLQLHSEEQGSLTKVISDVIVSASSENPRTLSP